MYPKGSSEEGHLTQHGGGRVEGFMEAGLTEGRLGAGVRGVGVCVHVECALDYMHTW